MKMTLIGLVAYWAILSIPTVALGLLAGGAAWTPFVATQCILVIGLAALGAIAIAVRMGR